MRLVNKGGGVNKGEAREQGVGREREARAAAEPTCPWMRSHFVTTGLGGITRPFLSIGAWLRTCHAPV